MKPPLTIYPTAPPNYPLHKLNQQLQALFVEDPILVFATVPPVALPESVNRISAMSPEFKPSNLPIVTTVDFKIARNGNGWAWHKQ